MPRSAGGSAQQGNAGALRAEGLRAFAVLRLGAAANLAATRWAGGWAVKETLDLPACLNSLRMPALSRCYDTSV